MLHSAEVVALVAEAIEHYALAAVVDPVMLATGGTPLLNPDAVELLRQVLLPQTYLLTPNIPEAEVLTGMAIRGEEAMEEAVRALKQPARATSCSRGDMAKGRPSICCWQATPCTASPLSASRPAIPTAPVAVMRPRSPHSSPRGCRWWRRWRGPRCSSTQRSALPPTWGAATGRSTTGRGRGRSDRSDGSDIVRRTKNQRNP